MHKTCILFYCFIFFRWFLSDVPSHGKEKLLSGNTHGYSASGASAPLHALLLRGLLPHRFPPDALQSPREVTHGY